ncbi:hypothetical protein [Photobacterium damselae]|uniref:hypothetical protein n=1 Tax=Photobacterium damselae TaxID=38293 RepID=UPI001F35E061|nr:hypothetical protein [Photobacterium damselae]UKA04959.1 hypothetical protein IHC89_22195 [Photobacterium damselae subsp. damselae]
MENYNKRFESLEIFTSYDARENDLSFLFIAEDLSRPIDLKIKIPSDRSINNDDYQKLILKADAAGQEMFANNWESILEKETLSIFSKVQEIIDTQKLPRYASYTRSGTNPTGIQILLPTPEKKGKGHARIRLPFSFIKEKSLFLTYQKSIAALVMHGRKEWGENYLYGEKLLKRGGTGRKNNHYKTRLNTTGETNILLTERTKTLKNGGVSIYQQYIVRVIISGVLHTKWFGFNGRYKNSESNRTQAEALACAKEYRDKMFEKASSDK